MKKFLLTIPIIIGLIYFNGFFINKIEKLGNLIVDKTKKENRPNSIIMYDNLESLSKKYGIPKHIVYNIAYLETKYRGPYDWNYKHNLVSSAGALGPMQVMPRTANFIRKDDVPKNVLLNDIQFNIETSLILLKNLYDKYKNWGVVCGYYNTGYPVINDYANFCISNKNYKKNWLKLKVKD